MNTSDFNTLRTVLGNEVIDRTHDELIELLLQINNAPKEDYPNCYHALMQHTKNHFLQEEKLMQESGDPNFNEHKAEHTRVLNELSQFEKRVVSGRINFAKAYTTNKLPEWFKIHTTTMDSALVAHMKK